MKTKDLINELLKCDPEAEVVLPTGMMWAVEELPGYWDGHYEVLIENPLKKPYYSVEGMVFTRANNKVVLKSLSMSDLIWNCNSIEEAESLKFQFDSSLNTSQQHDILSKVKKEKAKFSNYMKKQAKQF